MTKAEYIERYGLEWYEQYKERTNAHNKERYSTDPEFRKQHSKTSVKCIMKRYSNDSEYKQQVMDEHKNYVKDKYANDENYRFKHNTRVSSYHILFKKRHHSKLKGYEIHHCFGYDDPSRFIYIPRELHRAIHALLRDNSIDADSNHFNSIAQLINECTEYAYLSN